MLIQKSFSPDNPTAQTIILILVFKFGYVQQSVKNRPRSANTGVEEMMQDSMKFV